jgi:CoA:oxalate CoA-transferase
LFCAAINRVDLIDDPHFGDGWLRTFHYQELEPALTRAFKSKTTAEWIAALETVGIPCSRVNNIARAAAEPQVAAREMISEVEQPGSGKFKVVNTPFKFSRTPGKAGGHAPELGEHTAQVLREWLGLSEAEISRLKQA